MLQNLLSVALVIFSPIFSESIFSEKAGNFGDTNGSAGVTNSNELIAQEIPAIQEEGFVFEFLGCETTPNSDTPLTCDFMIENSQDVERDLWLYAYQSSNQFSRVIDSNGNEIFASVARLGKSSNGGYASAVLPSGIPLRASLSFDEAPEGGIRILDIGSRSYNVGGFDIEFRFSR